MGVCYWYDNSSGWFVAGSNTYCDTFARSPPKRSRNWWTRFVARWHSSSRQSRGTSLLVDTSAGDCSAGRRTLQCSRKPSSNPSPPAMMPGTWNISCQLCWEGEGDRWYSVPGSLAVVGLRRGVGGGPPLSSVGIAWTSVEQWKDWHCIH